MVKAGILSMQRIYNYGSFLQAYALKKILEELGCKVEFVDYHPGECLGSTNERSEMQRKLRNVEEVLCSKASFTDKVKYIIYKRNYGHRYYPLLGINEAAMNYNPEVDILVIGSDEVFNCTQQNTRIGYSRELFGYGSYALKTVSYAASFGNTTIEKIRQYEIEDTVKEDLLRLDWVSVRDKNSEDIVESLAGRKPKVHLDPVLIYNWKALISSKKPVKEKYMVLYGYAGRFRMQECRKIKEFAEKRNLRIVCIGGIQAIPHSFIECDPFKVLSYFAYAEYVVTDTFHGVALSVVTQKKFAVFVRESGYGNSEKITDLLLRLNIPDKNVSELRKLEDVLEKEIDYQKTEKICDSYREDTYRYLNSVLE